MPDTAVIPAYAIETEAIAGKVVAHADKAILAASKAAVVMRETRLPPTIYFPKADLKVELVQQPEFRTFCPFKGTTTYWDVVIGEEKHAKAAWSYERALPEALSIEGMVCFSPTLLTKIEKGVQMPSKAKGIIQS